MFSTTIPSQIEQNTTYYYTTIDFTQSLYNLDNNSLADVPYLPAYIRYTSVVFCIIIMLVGVIGNIMVPIVILKSKDMRNSTNIFLVNLSVADLLVLLVCVPTVLVEVNTPPETWVLGEEMCKIVPFVEMTVAHASVLTILAISFERYYAICKPLKAGYICTKTRASLICFLTWLFAASFTSPVLVIAEYKFETYIDGSVVPICLTQADLFWKALFFVLTVTVFFFIPLVMLIIVYTVIARTLMKNPNIIAPPKLNFPPNQHLKYRKQVVLMLGGVVLAFFICLLPFRIFILWIIIVSDETLFNLSAEKYYNILYFCRIMFYLNSAVNPILYNVISSKFRNAFLRLCGYTSRKKKRRKNDEKGRQNTTSSTNTSSQNTSESFWSRYSNRKRSGKENETPANDIVKNNNKHKVNRTDIIKTQNVAEKLNKIHGIKGERFV